MTSSPSLPFSFGSPTTSPTTSPNPINYLGVTDTSLMPDIFDVYNYNAYNGSRNQQSPSDSRQNNQTAVTSFSVKPSYSLSDPYGGSGSLSNCNSPTRLSFPDTMLNIGSGGSDNGMLTLSPPYQSSRAVNTANMSDSEPDSAQDVEQQQPVIQPLTGGLEAISQCDRLSEWKCFAEKNINPSTIKEYYPYPYTLITLANFNRHNENLTMVNRQYLMMFLQHVFGFTVLSRDALYDFGSNASKFVNCTWAGKPDRMQEISCRPVGSYMHLLNLPDTVSPRRNTPDWDSFREKSSLFIDLAQVDAALFDCSEDRIPVSHLFANGENEVHVLQDCWSLFHLNYEELKTLFQSIGTRAAHLHSAQQSNSNVSGSLDANITWYQWLTRNYPGDIGSVHCALNAHNEILASLAKYIGYYNDYEKMYISFGLAVQNGWKLQLSSHSLPRRLKQIVSLTDRELDTILKFSLLTRIDDDPSINIGSTQEHGLSSNAYELLQWLMNFCQAIRARHNDVLKQVQQIVEFYDALPGKLFPVSEPNLTEEQRILNQVRFEKMPFSKTMFSMYDLSFQCGWQKFTEAQLSAANRVTMDKEREIGRQMMRQMVDQDTSFSHNLNSISFYLRSLWNMWWSMFSTNLVSLQSEDVLKALETSIDIDPKVSFLLNTNDHPIASMLLDKQLNRCNPNTLGARDRQMLPSALSQEQPILFFNVELAGGWTGKWEDKLKKKKKGDDENTRNRSVIRLYMKIVFTGNSVGDFLLNINSRQQTHVAFQLADQLLELFSKFVVHLELYSKSDAQLIEAGQVRKQIEPFGYLSVKEDVSYTPNQEIDVIVNPDPSENLSIKKKETHAYTVLRQVLETNGMAGYSFTEYCDQLVKLLHSPCGRLIPHYYRMGMPGMPGMRKANPNSLAVAPAVTMTSITNPNSVNMFSSGTGGGGAANAGAARPSGVQPASTTSIPGNLRDISVARRPVTNIDSSSNNSSTTANPNSSAAVPEKKKRKRTVKPKNK